MARVVLIPTPVGNLEDITFRAVRMLKEADLIAAEDTRTSGILMKHYQIGRPMLSLHTHNEHQRVDQLLDRVEAENLNLAVVSDAGTPGISDPGFLIVRAAIARGIEVETLPGPTAFVPALISSGLPSDRFIFEGFLPVKKGRQTAIQRLLIETRTLILYESPHRLLRTLQDLALVLGEDRSVCVSREISKKFENHYRSTLAGAIAYYTEHQVKGEIVIVLAGSK